jgi:hypothetical protein
VIKARIRAERTMLAIAAAGRTHEHTRALTAAGDRQTRPGDTQHLLCVSVPKQFRNYHHNHNRRRRH